MNVNRFVDNPKPPHVRFIRKNGRIIPITTSKSERRKIRIGKVKSLVADQVEVMQAKIDTAEAGQRVHLGYGTSHEVRGFKSSFPKFYGDIGFKNKEDFRKVLQKPGVRQERLMERAVDDLKANKSYGFGLPKTRGIEFKVASREIYDNSGIVFRRIGNRVVPVRVAKPEPFEAKHSIPEPFL